MADVYRYSLTRICLRTGALTLPLNLLGVFPERGEIVAVDPQKDTEFTLRVEGRRVLGLEPYFEAHDLRANDELTIRPLEDGRFTFTAVVRPRRPDLGSTDALAGWLGAFIEAGVPMSESEMRAVHPGLPSGAALREALERESRLVVREGRWQPRLPDRRHGADGAGAVEPAGDAQRRRSETPESRVVEELGRVVERTRASGRTPRPADARAEELRQRAAEEAAAEQEAARAEHEAAALAAAEAELRAEQQAAERAQRRAAQREAAERAVAERELAERAAEDRAAAKRAAAERAAAERAAAERAEGARALAERAEAERSEAEHAAAERVAAEPAGRGAADRDGSERELAEQRRREEADRARAGREESARARAEVEATLEAQAAREAEIMALVEADELARVVGATSGATDALSDEVRRSRERLAAHAEDDVQAAARRQRDERADHRRGAASDAGSESFSWDQPLGRRLRFPWTRRREEPKPAPEPARSTDPLKLDRLGEPRPVERSGSSTPMVSAAPRPTLFAADVGLNSASPAPGDPAKTKRAREAFATLGYRVEGLAHGQLMLHADFGRRFARVLVHVLPDRQHRLDWASLLARRREAGATHLAVVGDQRDLHTQVAPADLARATLWSWAGLERVMELATTMPLGPFDLEPHFERDGLYELGLSRFERSITKRVQERGAFSAVIERLAQLRAPAVFMLEDVAGAADMPREQTLRVLERLSEAPWHLVSRIDSGEFCLRFRAHDALDQIGIYAASLRARLPERQRDLVRGLPDGVDPIDAADLPADADLATTERPEAPGATAAAATTAQAATAPAAKAPATKAAASTPERSERAATGGAVGERRFAGPGLGAEDEPDADDVDLSLVAVKRPRRTRS